MTVLLLGTVFRLDTCLDDTFVLLAHASPILTCRIGMVLTSGVGCTVNRFALVLPRVFFARAVAQVVDGTVSVDATFRRDTFVLNANRFLGTFAVRLAFDFKARVRRVRILVVAQVALARHRRHLVAMCRCATFDILANFVDAFLCAAVARAVNVSAANLFPVQLAHALASLANAFVVAMRIFDAFVFDTFATGAQTSAVLASLDGQTHRMSDTFLFQTFVVLANVSGGAMCRLDTFDIFALVRLPVALGPAVVLRRAMFVGCTLYRFTCALLVAHVLLVAMFPVRAFDRFTFVLLANFKRLGRNVNRAMCMLCARHLAADFVQ